MMQLNKKLIPNSLKLRMRACVCGKYLCKHSSSVRAKVIEKYLQSTHASTHSDYTMSVLDIFKLDREGENDGFLQLHNRYRKSANTSFTLVQCCF